MKHSLAVRLLVAALFTGSLLAVTPSVPAHAQTMTAPAGQNRVTAPGGLRGRATLRHHRHRLRGLRRHRHR